MAECFSRAQVETMVARTYAGALDDAAAGVVQPWQSGIPRVNDLVRDLRVAGTWPTGDAALPGSTHASWCNTNWMPRVGDAVWVRAVVTNARRWGAARLGIGVRIAERVGSTCVGSSTRNARLVDGVGVVRVVEVPADDVAPG